MLLKTLIFSLVTEALMSLIYHRPAGENFSFSSVHTLSDDGRSISRNFVEKHNSTHDKLRKHREYN